MLELERGIQLGYDVPNPSNYTWLQCKEPRNLPSEWLVLDLGPGELAAMALALEHPDHIVLLDDALARSIAQAASFMVWGSLRLLLEAKKQGITAQIEPLVDKLSALGMWISADVRHRILTLAGEET